MSLVIKKAYQPNDIIYQKNDVALNIFLMKEGIVDIFDANDQGQEVFVKSIENGHIFGEPALIGNHHRTYTAKARTAVVCICISVKELNKKVEEQDPFIKALYKILVTNLKSVRKLGASPKNNLDAIDEMVNSEES